MKASRGVWVAAVGACLFTATIASGQYSSDFNSLMGDADGINLTGQDAYYIPPNTTSTDFEVYTYAANGPQFPANPNGGTKFIAGIGEAGSPLSFERAQRDIAWGPGTWTVEFDVAAKFLGTLPTAQNAGSVSTQDSNTAATFIALARWTDVNTAANWNADYVWFNAAGTSLTESVPNAGFQNLLVNHWYHWKTTFDFASNRILEVAITDLTNGNTVTHNPQDRYLRGGTNGAPLPTGFRFFAGGSVAGNTMAFDNISITPEPASLVLLALGGLALARRRG